MRTNSTPSGNRALFSGSAMVKMRRDLNAEGLSASNDGRKSIDGGMNTGALTAKWIGLVVHFGTFNRHRKARCSPIAYTSPDVEGPRAWATPESGSWRTSTSTARKATPKVY
jgi:hypothetical protein